MFWQAGYNLPCSIQQAATINLMQLAQYIAGELVSLPQEALQVMDVVLRQATLRL